jgi:BASS family bile acid:Na+ symporter
MTLQEIILLVLKASIIAFVFGLGLKSKPEDILSLVRRPSLLARTLLSMNVVMPLFAVALVSTLTLRPGVAIALLALSLSPVPPLMPGKAARAGGDTSYAVGMFVIVSLVSIVWVPFAVQMLGSFFGRPLGVPPATMAKIVAILILGPLLLGMAVRKFAASFAKRIQPSVSIAADVALVVPAALILFSAWRAILGQIGDGTALILAAFVIVGLVVGHLLGGPVPEERTDLALATALRHPGVALTVAAVAFPNEHELKALVALYLIVNVLISLPYVRWRAKHEAERNGTRAKATDSV